VGFVSYGALFGIALACLAFARGFGYPLLLISDVAVRGLYIAYAIGRIGCLTYGCCWGKASLSYGILYRNPEAKVVRMSGGPSPMLHPAPLYSAIEGLVLFIILNSLCYFPLPPGFLTVFGLLLYPMGRAFIEPYRERRFYLSSALNEGHIGCALMFLAGVIMLFLISPGMGPSSPRPLNLEGFIQGLSLIPVILAVSALVFFMTGFHWRKVGTW
jgi:phosphatidylglycerol:prolipoprotein diacylglycerol transferase